jgi:hypothetical protein
MGYGTQFTRLTHSRRRRSIEAGESIHCRLPLGVRRPRARPRGITLIELTVSLLLMTTAVAAIVQLVTTVGGQRRLIEQRRVALREVANRAERIALMPWNETAADELATWQPSDELKTALPKVECVADVTEEMEQPGGRRIRLVVRANDASGQLVEYAALTVWKFRAEEQP